MNGLLHFEVHSVLEGVKKSEIVVLPTTNSGLLLLRKQLWAPLGSKVTPLLTHVPDVLVHT